MKLTRLCSHVPVAALLPARVGQEYTGPVGFSACVLAAIQAGAPGWAIKRYATAWCIWKTIHLLIYFFTQEQLMGKNVAGASAWMRTLAYGFSLGCCAKLLLLVS